MMEGNSFQCRRTRPRGHHSGAPPSTKPLDRRASQEREVASHVNNRAASPTSHRRKSAESKTCSNDGEDHPSRLPNH